MPPIKKAFIATLLGPLKKQWPTPVCEVRHRNAYELMVGVILSAQSTDKTVNALTPALFKKYPTIAAMAQASPLDIEKRVYRTGFFRTKTKSILGACRMLMDVFGGEMPQTMKELTQLPGIGRKSANVILGAIYGLTEGIVVDTHMIRLATERLKLATPKDPVKLEAALCKMVPQKEWIFFSQAMVLHGRYICVARQPRCWACALREVCPFKDKTPKPIPDMALPTKTIVDVPIKWF